MSYPTVLMDAPDLQLQQVSVTRKMAASLPRLRSIAQGKGLKMHHLGAGYPHPEVTDPRKFLQHQSRYFEFQVAGFLTRIPYMGAKSVGLHSTYAQNPRKT